MNAADYSEGAGQDTNCCPIVEFRQYTLHPGKREVLIELFDREFIETQEALGMKVLGQFRDLDDPDRFVWLRGIRDLPSRLRGLSSFYSGPVWKKHRGAANATMIDSDNVLLLRPARRSYGFSNAKSVRPPRGAKDIPVGLITATIYYFNTPDDHFVNFFDRSLKPLITSAGVSVLACFVTEESPNNFPALPVREGEYVFAWFASFRDETAYEHYTAALAGSQEWSSIILKELNRRIKGPPQVLRLSPTARALLRP